MAEKIDVQGKEITIISREQQDYISLTDSKVVEFDQFGKSDLNSPRFRGNCSGKGANRKGEQGRAWHHQPRGAD